MQSAQQGEQHGAVSMNGPALVRIGAALALAGALTSGPLGLWLVGATHPQPPWRDAATFVAAYHWVQLVPYVFGFALVTGFVLLIAGLHASASESIRARTSAALVFAAAFAAMILMNYAIQTTFIPALVGAWSPEQAPVLESLTMSNPGSLAWALEMWGYAVLGVATWLAAPAFAGPGLPDWTARLFFWNGPLSIGSAILTAASPGWVLTEAGLWAFGVWNLLVVMLAFCAFLAAPRLSPR
jgi:hypothetical protein